jgi:hypothetical protein
MCVRRYNVDRGRRKEQKTVSTFRVFNFGKWNFLKFIPGRMFTLIFDRPTFEGLSVKLISLSMTLCNCGRQKVMDRKSWEIRGRVGRNEKW